MPNTMRKNVYPGKFIVLEGIGGSGKTTQTKLLCDTLAVHDIPVRCTKRPTTESIFGCLVRVLLTHSNSVSEMSGEIKKFFNNEGYYIYRRFATEEQKTYLNTFEEIAQEITVSAIERLPFFLQIGMTFDCEDHRIRTEIPALQNEINVVSDRDFLSSLAYGGGDGLDWKFLLRMHFALLGRNFIMPNAIIFIEVSPEIGLNRTMEKQRGTKEMFDDLKKLKKIREIYHRTLAHSTIKKLSNIYMINGEYDKKTVQKEIRAVAEIIFKQKLA